MIALGVQNDALPAAELAGRASSMRAAWVRVISTTDADPAPVAERLRAAHERGLRVVLTIGGTGTQQRKPGVVATLRWVSRLPAADAYTWTNEPDLSGRTACNYARGWKRLRRVLGRRLLWGDFSPHAPLTYTLAARHCATLPAKLDFAIHPYRVRGVAGWAEGSFDRLPAIRRSLTRRGVRVRWWVTEYGQLGMNDSDAAKQWRSDLADLHRWGAACAIAYDVQGPTWNTKLGPETEESLRGPA